MKRYLGQFAILWLVLWLPSAAWADAIPRPSACPPGTVGHASHSGTSCSIASCETDADCGKGYGAVQGTTCQDWRICTFERETTVRVHRRQAQSIQALDKVMRTYVVGTCDPDEACTGLEQMPPRSTRIRGNEEIECENRRVCVPQRLPPLPTTPLPMEPEKDAADSEALSVGDDGSSEAPSEGRSGASAASESGGGDGRGCGCSPGLVQSIPLALSALIGGLALVRRRET